MDKNLYSEEFAMALSFTLGYIVLIGLVIAWAISNLIHNKRRKTVWKKN